MCGAKEPPPVGVKPAAGGAKTEELELKLKRLERWVKLFGIAAAAFGMASTAVSTRNALQQNKLFRAQEVLSRSQEKLARSQEEVSRSQAAELFEKRRVNLKVEMTVAPGLTPDSVMALVTLTNNSTRVVNIAMTGVRVWRSSWKSGDLLEDHPELLVYSDTVVYDCPASVCPGGTANSSLRDGHPFSLTVGESQQDGYGPYRIPAEDRARGVWVQAFARTVEKDDGVCVLTGPPSLAGGFPEFCDESRKDEPDCARDSGCLSFNVAPFPFLPPRK